MRRRRRICLLRRAEWAALRWGRRAADEGRRLARGYSFRIKRISPRASQERFWGRLRRHKLPIPRRCPKGTGSLIPLLLLFPPQNSAAGALFPPPDPSYDQREGCALLWKPSRSLRGFLLRRTLEQGTKDESGVPVVIPGISPCGRRGWGWPGRSRTGIRRL